MPVEGLDLIHSLAFIIVRDMLHRLIRHSSSDALFVAYRRRCYTVAIRILRNGGEDEIKRMTLSEEDY